MKAFDAKLVSFIVPAHQDHEFLQPCLSALLKQNFSDWRTEIILVDNSLAANLPAPTEVHKVTTATSSASHARNAGIKHAKGQWIAFVDADTVLQPDWLAVLLSETLQQQATAAQGLIRTVSKFSGGLFAEFRQLQAEHGKNGLLASEWALPSLNSSACLIDRGYYGDISFDERMKNAEDVELSWRLLRSRSSRWFFSQQAVATSFEPSESIVRFWKRNFYIGQAMAGLCTSYSTKVTDLFLIESQQAKRWVTQEILQLYQKASLARLARLGSAISFYFGLSSGRKMLGLKAPQNDHNCTIIHADSIRTIKTLSLSSQGYNL